MKHIVYIIYLAIGMISCHKAAVDMREEYIFPIDPNTDPDGLNNILVFKGSKKEGELPDSKNISAVNILFSVESAKVSNDNYLFLPFSFNATGQLKGLYVQVAGAENYWDIPIDLKENSNINSYAISIGIPENVKDGKFALSYKIYDDIGNISSLRKINVSVELAESMCTGAPFPRVSGSDGITVQSYTFGDEPGVVQISYYMYTQKDRMDIRYNNKWVATTGPVLLGEGEAPPFKTCNEASENEGFVSGGGTFSIPYDPRVSREISIYVSGCLQGGTLWYFDVLCPGGPTGDTGPSICQIPSARDRFDPSDENYHSYPQEGATLDTEICDTEKDPNCSAWNVFREMLTQSNFNAPTADTLPMQDCKVTWVTYLPTKSPIVSKIDAYNYTVTNYTLADYKDEDGKLRTHFLHPGKVTRKVKVNGTKVVIQTEGEGAGRLPSLNEMSFTTSYIWQTKVNKDFKKHWDEINRTQ